MNDAAATAANVMLTYPRTPSADERRDLVSGDGESGAWKTGEDLQDKACGNADGSRSALTRHGHGVSSACSERDGRKAQQQQRLPYPPPEPPAWRSPRAARSEDFSASHPNRELSPRLAASALLSHHGLRTFRAKHSAPSKDSARSPHQAGDWPEVAPMLPRISPLLAPPRSCGSIPKVYDFDLSLTMEANSIYRNCVPHPRPGPTYKQYVHKLAFWQPEVRVTVSRSQHTSPAHTLESTLARHSTTTHEYFDHHAPYFRGSCKKKRVEGLIRLKGCSFAACCRGRG